MKQFSDTHGWNKSTYFSKSRKHNYIGDSSQHTFGWSNSVIPTGDTSRHTFQNIKNQPCRWFKSAYFWMKQFSDTHGWYKSTYFSKSRKHNYVNDSSQHTLGNSNSETPMGDTSQHTFQNQENITGGDSNQHFRIKQFRDAHWWKNQHSQKCSFKIKKTQLCRLGQISQATNRHVSSVLQSKYLSHLLAHFTWKIIREH